MNKQEILKMLESINSKKQEVKNLVSENKIEEAQAAKAELQEMQAKFDILKDMEDEQKMETPKNATPLKKDAIHEFANAARNGFRNYNNEDMSATGVDGGYTVPEDIMTRVEELKEAKFNLADLVSTENVTTLSGRRTYKTRKQHTGFQKIGEGQKISKIDGPTFGIVEYKIAKYAGYLPVTNELLADSDANITAVLTNWLAEEDIATRNGLVLGAVDKKTAVDLKSLDGIKKAVNVTLGSRYAGSVQIVTNDDGLNYLDTLQDDNKRYLLSRNVNENEPMEMVLAVGAKKIPVVVVPNDILTTAENKVPFKVGSFKDYAKIFDRQKLTIAVSSEASTTDVNAFEEDLILFRGIDRLDIQVLDDEAMVNGYITVNEGN